MEFEYESTCTDYSSFNLKDWKNLTSLFTSNLSAYHPAFFQCMSQYLACMEVGSIGNSSADEEILKGNVSVIFIACLILIQNSNVEETHTVTCSELCHDPITSTLSAAISIFVLRLRCAMIYGAQNMLNDCNYNIVQVVVESLERYRAYFDIHPANFAICVCSSLAMIPDAIFGSAGGARGSLSLNPHFVRRCYKELNDKRQGMDLVIQSFHGLSSLRMSWIGSVELSIKVDYHLLAVCERWAAIFTLPFEFVEMTAPLIERYIDATIKTRNSNLAVQQMGYHYLIRLFEGACMVPEDIHNMYLGLSSEQLDSSDQDTQKRQYSKSKHRFKGRVESISTQDSGGDMLSQAGKEAFERGDVACRSSLALWNIIFKSVYSNLESLNDMDSIDGEGDIGCLLMCCSACVPFIIEFAFESKYRELLERLLCSTSKFCCSSSRYIRSQSMDIIERIYSALVTRTKMTTNHAIPEFEQSISFVLCECCIQLASKCSYPLEYFACMTEESDEELENERNDVRDLLRSICDVEGCYPSRLSLLILQNILGFCQKSLNETSIEKSETTVHIFSSLAKPINWISSSLYSTGNISSYEVVSLTIHIFHKFCGDLLVFLSSSSQCLRAFSVIRLLSLAIASFSPTLDCVGKYLTQCSDNRESLVQFYETLGLIVTVTIASLQNIPELFGDNSQSIVTHLNIRGAMRAPGGEDHVSCIALLRLSSESDNLAANWLDAGAKMQQISTENLLLTLIQVHDDLKLAEMQRGYGIDYGSGVTPKTRRILLNIISQLVFRLHGKITISKSTASRVDGLFQKNYEYIVQIYGSQDSSIIEKMFHVCEATFDLASYPSDLIYSSLCPSSPHLHGYCCIIQLALSGYSLRWDVTDGKHVKFQVRIICCLMSLTDPIYE